MIPFLFLSFFCYILSSTFRLIPIQTYTTELKSCFISTLSYDTVYIAYQTEHLKYTISTENKQFFDNSTNTKVLGSSFYPAVTQSSNNEIIVFSFDKGKPYSINLNTKDSV